MLKKPLTVAWISDFPLEWLPDLPDPLCHLPRRHPATWQLVLLKEFEKNADLRLHVILLRGRIKKDFTFERNGVNFHVLKAAPWLRLGTLFWTDTLRIKQVCNAINPDLVHAWGSEKGATLIAYRLKRPYLVTVQGLFAWYQQMVRLPVYYQFIAQVENVSLPRAALVTTESTFAVQFLQRHFPGLRVRQAEHAPNQAFFQVHRRPQTNPIHFISVGELSFRKGTDLLLRALDLLIPELSFRLTLISSPDVRYLRKLRPELSPGLWERIEFKHDILPEQVARLLEEPTISLLPTRADVSPNAIKEAVVAGVPVVASEVGGIPDYVQSGENGLLFPAGNLDQFIGTIREAVRHPLFGRGQVSPASLAHSRDYLSPARMAENFLVAYARALETAVVRS